MSNVSVAAVYTSFLQQSPVQRECSLSSFPQAVNQLSKAFLSWQLSNSQIQDHNSSNMIGGIFQLKALLVNSMLNQRHQSCRNRFSEMSQVQHYSPLSIIQNTGYSKGYIRQIHNSCSSLTNSYQLFFSLILIIKPVAIQ